MMMIISIFDERDMVDGYEHGVPGRSRTFWPDILGGPLSYR